MTITLPASQPPLDPRLVALAKIVGRAIALRRLREQRTARHPGKEPTEPDETESRSNSWPP